MRRLRARLDRMEAQASMTMGDARDLLAVAQDLVADLADGIHFELEIAGRKLPITLTLDPREKEDTKS
jgi:hypothetical protein